MKNINNYLILVAALLAFYVILMLYIRSSKQSFTPVDSGIPAVEQPPQLDIILPEENIYITEDTRMQYPLLPPVNPMIRRRVIRDTIPANPDLYTSQTYTTNDSVLDTPSVNTNELLYSGGETQMLSIPLQFNYPYNEQLRSQDILITPYNKIKYGNC